MGGAGGSGARNNRQPARAPAASSQVGNDLDDLDDLFNDMPPAKSVRLRSRLPLLLPLFSCMFVVV